MCEGLAAWNIIDLTAQENIENYQAQHAKKRKQHSVQIMKSDNPGILHSENREP